MFGHQSDDKPTSTQIPDYSIDGVMSPDPTQPAGPPPTPGPLPAWQHPGTPLDTPPPPTDSAPAAVDPLAVAVVPTDAPAAVSEPPMSPSPEPDYVAEPPAPIISMPTTDNSSPVDTNDLIDIKQQALGQLSPLIDQLEQSPEDKFRTTMMMIQASDDQTLIQTAYQAAQAITDERTRAQALLDVINEINYFTQQHPEA